jgi:trk system potassium uptake protein
VTTQIGNLFAHRTERESIAEVGWTSNRSSSPASPPSSPSSPRSSTCRPAGARRHRAVPGLALARRPRRRPLLLVADEARKAVVRTPRGGRHERRSSSAADGSAAGWRPPSADGATPSPSSTRPGALDRLGTRPRRPGVAGDGCDRDRAGRAGIDRADGLAAVTGSDEVNAVLARLAATMFSGAPGRRAHLRPRQSRDLPPPRRADDRARSPGGRRPARRAAHPLRAHPGGEPRHGPGRDRRRDRARAARRAPAGELHIPGETQVVALTRDGATSLCTSGGVLLRAGDVAHLAVTSTRRLEALLGLRTEVRSS